MSRSSLGCLPTCETCGWDESGLKAQLDLGSPAGDGTMGFSALRDSNNFRT